MEGFKRLADPPPHAPPLKMHFKHPFLLLLSFQNPRHGHGHVINGATGTFNQNTFQTPGVLSPSEFRTFWLRAKGDPSTNQFTIAVGRGGEREPFLRHTWEGPSELQRSQSWDKYTDIKMVAFSCWHGHTADWKILTASSAFSNLQFKTPNYDFKYYSTSTVAAKTGMVSTSSNLCHVII